ncbi:Ionotropic receptor 146, partial [Hyalella azteca]
MRVIFMNFPVYNVAVPGRPPRLGGVMVTVFRMIADILNFCFTPVLLDQNIYGEKLPNGTWTAKLGLLDRK